ncbi:MAG TPA: DUF3426 domain-containing protein [Ramlibacter sp.]|uniref:DUF3426 domain-containing protein n=1 Tax=Ramlibacter sp. TaxID=1917967 RepID=UPI002D80904F|nr:DUF3426 domain-containing protein [Ramlibacter sp.]HET8747872.1 DUF3426 domain-containing protein [Ramlibacter sp.]
MSLITSCPACGTMFRVVPDQLKISEGWVRCGHCSEVFDAPAHMVDESVLEQLRTAEPASRFPTDAEVPAFLAARRSEPEPEPQPESESEFEPAPELPPATMPEELATRPTALYGPPPEGAAAGAPAAEPADSASSYGPDSESLEPSPLDTPFVFRRSDLLDREDTSVLPPAPSESEWPESHDAAAAEELHDVSFVRQARRRAFWRRPLVRTLLAVAGVVLAALLALQVGYHDRDRLALQQPQLRPALERMCALLQCRLGPPRQIESIVIESSGFTRVRNDTYRLAFTVRNTARVQVAVPAMELTITDAQDQAIARRVLTPSELGATGDAIGPAAEWSGAVGVAVSTNGASRVAGYRLLAFYP